MPQRNSRNKTIQFDMTINTTGRVRNITDKIPVFRLPPRSRWDLRSSEILHSIVVISDGIIGIFHWHNPPGRTMVLELTQPLTELSTRNISWGLRWPVRRADNLTTFMCQVSWNLGTSTSWNPQGLFRPVIQLLYLIVVISCRCLRIPIGRFFVLEDGTDKPIGCSENSVKNYLCALRNIPDERRSHCRQVSPHVEDKNIYLIIKF